MLESRYFVTFLVVGYFITAIDSEQVKVIGGRDANEGEFPFQVSLQKYRLREHLCGGVILNVKVVISSAQCISRTVPQSLIVVAGIYRFSDYDKAIYRHVDKAYYNFLDWMKGTPKDVTLIKISDWFPLDGKTLASVSIMMGSPGVGTALTVVGWGIKEPDQKPDVLQVVEMVLTPDAECEDRLTKISDEYVKHKNGFVCASPKGGQGCQGDQGGSLIVNGKLLAIVSGRVDNCGSPDQPSVFTAVGNLRLWIRRALLDSGAQRMHQRPSWLQLVVLLLSAKAAMEI